MYIVVCLFLCWGICYLFYHSAVISLCSSPLVFYLIKLIREERGRKVRWELQLQFKDGLQSLSDALSAGYSIENGFREAITDLSLLYPKEADILMEFRHIYRQLGLNKNIEEMVLDFGIRSGSEDILTFAEVLSTAKRTGGDLLKVIRMTSQSIGDKTDIQREIRTVVAAKKLEANIMSTIPVLIILYLWFSMPGFLEPMYTTLVGRIVMTVTLGFYVAAVLLLRKIVDINI